MTDLASLRRQFPVARDTIFLNHAGVAPTSLRTADAVRKFMVSLAELGRPSFDDWEALADECRTRFARLIGAGVHFLSADSHKWLLGMMGIGAVFADRSIIGQVRPPLLGWRSTTDAFDFDRVHFELKDTAGRYEEGSLAYPLIAGFSEALALLEEAGSESIESHVRALVDDLGNRLEELGCETGPPLEQRRHILVFRHPGTEGERLLDGLAERGVVASLRRGWIRASPHFYNTPQEMEAAAAAVRETIAGRA